jgi:hypothetical protein
MNDANQASQPGRDASGPHARDSGNSERALRPGLRWPALSTPPGPRRSGGCPQASWSSGWRPWPHRGPNCHPTQVRYRPGSAREG